MKIMLIDDEMSMQVLVRQILLPNGYEFCAASSGEAGLELMKTEKVDLVILDIVLPAMSGFQVCRELRKQNELIPIIFLSAKGDIVDKGEGFEAGGTDYLVKPFDPQELLLRVKAHLRQFRANGLREDGHVLAGEIDIDIQKHTVEISGRPVDLTAKEFRILYLLASNPGEVFTREQLVKEAWGFEYMSDTSSLSVFIRRIREKIEQNPAQPKLLVTVRNVGYKLDVSKIF